MADIVVKQMLDTSVRVTYSQAFATVEAEFMTDKGESCMVVFDMESFVKVMGPMDSGQQAVAQLPAKKARSWLRRWF